MEKLYRVRLDLYVHATSEEEALNQLEEYDFNNSIDKGHLTPEVEEVEEDTIGG